MSEPAASTPMTKADELAKPAVGDDLAPSWMPWGLAGVVVALLWVWSPGYIGHLLVMLGIYLLLGYSLNFVTGFGGLIVFCHAVFYGIGA